MFLFPQWLYHWLASWNKVKLIFIYLFILFYFFINYLLILFFRNDFSDFGAIMTIFLIVTASAGFGNKDKLFFLFSYFILFFYLLLTDSFLLGTILAISA